MNLLNPLNLNTLKNLGFKTQTEKRSTELLGHLHPDYRHLIYFLHS